MTYSLKYIEDSKGRIKAIQMSAADWKRIQKKLELADRLTEMHAGLLEAMTEVRLHQAGKKQLKSWREAKKDL